MTMPLDTSAEQIHLLDLLAANAWPAAVYAPVGSWVCRFTHGVTRRANSVWPRDWRAGADLASAILQRFAEWATEQGAEQLYLQVEQDNGPAANFYTKAGFQNLYTYHYRRGPKARAGTGQ